MNSKRKFSVFISVMLIALSVTLPRALALELLIDSNNNGVSDVWEEYYQIWNPSTETDLDQDGKSDYTEGVHGTDPRDKNSCFTFNILNYELATPALTWNSKKGKCYLIEWENPEGEWNVLSKAIPGDGRPLYAPINDVSHQAISYRISPLDDMVALPEIKQILEVRDADADGLNDWAEW